MFNDLMTGLKNIAGGSNLIFDQLSNDPETLQKRLGKEAKAYFAKLEKFSAKSKTNISRQVGVTFVTISSDKETKIETDARKGVGLGFVFNTLVQRLIEINASREYTIVDSSTFWGGSDYEGRIHKETHDIGEILNKVGGMDLMQCASHRVKIGGGDLRDLERNWDGIGKWRG